MTQNRSLPLPPEREAELAAVQAAETGADCRCAGGEALTPEERAQLSEWEYGPVRPVPHGGIPAFFARQVRMAPHAPALLADGVLFSYADLDATSNRVAHALLHILGGVNGNGIPKASAGHALQVSPHSANGNGNGNGTGSTTSAGTQNMPDLTVPDRVVGVLTGRNPHLAVVALGIWKAGAVYLPLDASLPAPRLRKMMEDARVRVLFDARTGADRRTRPVPDCLLQGPDKPSHRSGCAHLDMDAALLCPDHAVQRAADSAACAYIIFTSGSTGIPKGVAVSHGAFVNMICGQIAVLGITPADRLLAFALPSFDASLSEMFMALGAGASLYPVSRDIIDDTESFAAFVESHGLTGATLPPAYLRLFQRRDFPSLRFLLTAGEAPVREDALHYASRLAYYNAYGPTENAVCATMTRIIPHGAAAAEENGGTDNSGGNGHGCGNGRDSRNNGDNGNCGNSGAKGETCAGRAPLPMGKPLPNMGAHVLGPDLAPVPPGQPGELCLSGRSLAMGYVNRPDLNAASFVLCPALQNRRIYRTGDLVRWNAAGELEYLGRIGREVKVRGFRIDPGEVECALDELPDVLQCAVAAHRLPDEMGGSTALHGFLVMRGEMALPSPEVLRQWLLRTLPDYMVPSGWTQLQRLPLNRSGKIDYAALAAQAAATGADCSVPSGCSSQAAPAQEPEAAAPKSEIPAWQPATESTTPEMPPGLVLPMSLSQRQFWILHQSEPSAASSNMPVVVEFSCAPGAEQTLEERLCAAFSMIMDRHESLRTSFSMVDGTPMQTIYPHVPFTPDLRDLRESPTPDEDAQDLCVELLRMPLDITQPPPLRGLLIRLSGRVWLAVSLHHIVGDGQSVGIVGQELLACMEGDPLPAVEVQYQDFVRAEQRYLASQAMQTDRRYWLDILSRSLPRADITTGYERPAFRRGRGDMCKITLSAAQVSDFCRRDSLPGSLFMRIVACVAMLLRSRADGDSIVMGIPVSVRHTGPFGQVVGNFIVPQPLAVPVRAQEGFAAVLDSSIQAVAGAMEHCMYPPVRLYGDLGVVRDPARGALYDVMVTTPQLSLAVPAQGVAHGGEHDDDGDESAAAGMSDCPARQSAHTPLPQSVQQPDLKPARNLAQEGVEEFADDPLNEISVSVGKGRFISLYSGLAKFDLTFMPAILPDGGLMLVLEYDSDLYSRSTAKSMLESLRAMIVEGVYGQSVLNGEDASDASSAGAEETGACGASAQASPAASPAGTDELRRTMLAVWRTALGKPDLREQDNFFSVGGDSIKAISLCGELRKHGIPLSPAQLFRFPTVAEAAQACREAEETPEIPPDAWPVPVSPVAHIFIPEQTDFLRKFVQSLMVEVRRDQESVDEDRLETAFRAVVRHHPAFRFRLRLNDGAAFELLGSPRVYWKRVSCADEDVAETALREGRSIREWIDPCKGYNVGACLFSTPQAVMLLVVSAHTSVDMVSWRVLCDDLETAYRRGPGALVSGAAGFDQWLRGLHRHAESGAMEEELEFWRNMVSGRIAQLPLAVAQDEQWTVQEATVPPDVVDRLEALAVGSGLDMRSILLATLARSLAPVLEGDAVLLTFEGHGRQVSYSTLDVTRTVGWFTAAYPFRLPLDAHSPLQTLAGNLLEHMRQVPDGGTGFCMLCHARKRLEKPAASISFNYHGRETFSRRDGFGPSRHNPDLLTDMVSTRYSDPVNLSLVILEGTLHIMAQFPGGLLDADWMSGMLDRWKDNLGEMARSASASGVFPVHAPGQEALPVLPMQEALPVLPLQAALVESLNNAGQAAAGETTAGTVQFSFRLRASRCAALLPEVWRQVVQRHEFLRTVFVQNGAGGVMQRLMPEAAHAVTVSDGSGLEPEAQEAELQALLGFERGRSFRPSGPLMRVLFMRHDDDCCTMAWTFPRLFLEERSVSILLHDLCALYHARLHNEPAVLPCTVSLAGALSGLQVQNGDDTQAFWHRYLAGTQGYVPLLPRSGETAEAVAAAVTGNSTGDTKEFTAELPQGDSATLSMLGARWGVPAEALLCAAWGLFLAAASGRGDVLFASTTTALPQVQQVPEQVVGMFGQPLPLRLRVLPHSTLSALAQTVARDMKERSPFAHMPLPVEAGEDLAVGSGPDHVVQFGATPSLAVSGGLRLESVRMHAGALHGLSICAETDGIVRFRFRYDSSAHARKQVEQLAEQWCGLLRTVMESPERPVAEMALVPQGAVMRAAMAEGRLMHVPQEP